jgi:membrane protein
MAEEQALQGKHAQGKQATNPTRFGWRDWMAVLRRLAGDVGRHHLSVLAAGVAFFAMLALFPAIAALIGIYGLVANPADVSTHLSQIEPLLPEDAYGIIAGQVEAVTSAGSGSLGLAFALGLLFSLWSVRAAVAALMEGLNIVYREEEDRSLLRATAISLGLAVLIVLLAVAAIATIVAVPAVLRMIDLGPFAAWAAGVAPWLVLGFVVVLAIGIVYRYGPARAPARKRWVSLGAVVAALLWLVASVLFSFYVANFADYNKTYGSLGAIVILLMWFYAGGFAVLLGAALNAEMELHTARDTTTGPEKPMGEREAYVADHVT